MLARQVGRALAHPGAAGFEPRRIEMLTFRQTISQAGASRTESISPAPATARTTRTMRMSLPMQMPGPGAGAFAAWVEIGAAAA